MDFTDDDYNAEMIGEMLADHEQIKVLVRGSTRVIAVTDKRIIIAADSGERSFMPHHAIFAIEVGDSSKGGKLISINMHGGALERVIEAPDEQQAYAIATAAALG